VNSAAAEAALLDRINATITRIEGKSNELHGSIAGKVHWLPGPMQDRVREGWDQFCAFLQRIWDNLGTVVSNMGSISRLGVTADAWSDLVGVPVSGQVQAADAGLLSVDENWDGDAADVYRQMLPLQKAALEKVKTTLTDGLATALNDTVRGILAFWGLLIGALAALVGGLLGALASSATIFGMPAAPFIAAGAALTASASMIIGAETLKSVCSTANTTLRQKFDNSGFYRGHWPPAGTA
jgi:hypothetical protein